jgi:hypothetical protein
MLLFTAGSLLCPNRGRRGPGGSTGECLVAGGSAGSFVTASHAAWLVIAACGLWVIGMGVLTTSPWARRSASRTRELLIERASAARWWPGIMTPAFRRSSGPPRTCRPPRSPNSRAAVT